MQARWEHVSHEADMGVRGFGATKSEAFEQAALAMTAVITDPASVDALDAVQIECEAPRRRAAAGRVAQSAVLRDGDAQDAF
jgi:SHS2 domain-containing protein